MDVLAGARKRCQAAILTLALVTATASVCVTAAPRPVGLDDLDGVRLGQAVVLATIDLSPDARAIAVERGLRLRVVDASSGAILSDLGEGLNPKWSPQGTELAFYSNRSGTIQIWMWHRTTAQFQQLTNLPGGVDPDIATRLVGYISDAFHFSWSPDGSRIVFASRVAMPSLDQNGNDKPLILTTTSDPQLTLSGIFLHPGPGMGGVPQALDGRSLSFRPSEAAAPVYSELFIAEVTTSHVRQVTNDRATNYNPAWSPDGRSIAFARIGPQADILSATEGDIAILDVSTGQRRIFAGGPEIKSQPIWSADGRELAYLASPTLSGRPTIRVCLASNGSLVRSYPLDGPADKFDWDRSGGFIVSYVEEDLAATPTPGITDVRSIAPASKPPGVWAQAQNAAIAWIEGASGPGLWIKSSGPSSPKKLLDIELSDERLALGRSETISWRDQSGETHQGALLLPPNYRKGTRYPMIVDVYPGVYEGNWMAPMSGNQTWAAAGYIVFKPEPRAPHEWVNCSGSVAQCQRARGPDGWNVTFNDVMSGVADVVRRGYADPEKMCVYGHSNGGGVADYLVTQTGRFKCAVVVAPVLPNWMGSALLQTGSWGLVANLAGTKLWDDPLAYVRLSAVTRANQVKTPMLIAVGDEDGQFLLGAIEMYNALRFAGADVTLLRYPHEGHVFTGAGLHDFWRRYMEFFRHYLGPNEKTTAIRRG